MSLKVLYIINGLGTGGAQRSLAEMLPGLMSRGIDPAIVCLYHQHEGVEADLRRRVKVHFLQSGRLASRVLDLRRIIAQFHPDLLHTTISEADLAGRVAAIGTAVPVLTSLVNTLYVPWRLADPNIHPLRFRAAKVVDRITARLSTHFHAITHAVKTDAVHTLGIPPDRISVIERGRDPRRLGEAAPARRAVVRRRLGLGTDDLILINVARQEFQKGQRYILDAFPAVAARQPEAVLLIAGRVGHATRDLLARYKRSPAGARISFLGHREDVPDLLAAADVFVFPSLYEGLGGALIEAMALGLPIVASDVPAIREVVEAGRNAFLVPPADERGLANAIRSLLDDPQRRQAFGRHSRRIFEARFTLDRSTAAMASLYERVVGRGIAPTAQKGLIRRSVTSRAEDHRSSDDMVPTGG